MRRHHGRGGGGVSGGSASWSRIRSRKRWRATCSWRSTTRSPDLDMIAADDLRHLQGLLEKLDPREATILRMRFGLEVLETVRRAVGDDYIVGIRMPGDEMLKGGNFGKTLVQVGADPT